MAFRGGNAFNKLFFKPPSRYSEDIDLVQIKGAKIGDTIDLLRSFLDSWLGEPKHNYSEGRISLLYKFISDDDFPIKLKFEINTNENFSVLGFKDYYFESASSWTEGNSSITTFCSCIPHSKIGHYAPFVKLTDKCFQVRILNPKLTDVLNDFAAK